MTVIEILLLSLSLSADSFVVSMSSSVSAGKPTLKNSLLLAVLFGVTQAVFLFCGWAAGNSLVSYVDKVANFIALIILSYIGVSMIVSSGRENEAIDISGFRRMFAAAVATSLDAMAVGVSLAMANTELKSSLALMAAVLTVTMLASFTGVQIGAAAGRKFGRAAKIIGGAILICIGVKPFII